MQKMPSPWDHTTKKLEDLSALVDTVSLRLEGEIKKGNTRTLKELLYHVPQVILSDYARVKHG